MKPFCFTFHSKTEESLEIVWQAATAEKPTLKEHFVGNAPDADLAGNALDISE